MKRVVVFLLPLLIAILIFFGILLFLDRKTGKGALQITSTPQSSVFLDGKLVGKTPFCMAVEKCKIQEGTDVGDHIVKLVPVDNKYPFYDTKITISKSTLTAVDRTFADNGESDGAIISLFPLGSKEETEILVISLPDEANVFLDSNPVGVTPLLLKQVSESDHDLKITLDGYKNKSLKVKTTSGFKLTSLISLGINLSSSNSLVTSVSATPSPVSTITKVLILNTPTGFLRVRDNDSITSSEIGRVNPGESYELMEEKENWFKIKLTDGKLGWVSSSYAVKE